MPRVYRKTKSTRGKYTYTCTGCRQTVEPGQEYYEWEKRTGGPKRRHVACGPPRPTELSNRKTAAVEEAVQDVSLSEVAYEVTLDELRDADGTIDLEEVASQISDLLSPVADSADEVADEYESGADNMPDSLQDSPTAEAMRDVAERLREWAEELRDFEPSSSEAEVPERDEDDEDQDDEAWVAAAQDAVDTLISEMVSDAEDKMGDLPEYEG